MRIICGYHIPKFGSSQPTLADKQQQRKKLRPLLNEECSLLRSVERLRTQKETLRKELRSMRGREANRGLTLYYRLSDEKKRRIIQLGRGGKSWPEIADEFSVTTVTVALVYENGG